MQQFKEIWRTFRRRPMGMVGALMLRNRNAPGTPGAQCNRRNAPKVLGYGLGTGTFSGRRPRAVAACLRRRPPDRLGNAPVPPIPQPAGS